MTKVSRVRLVCSAIFGLLPALVFTQTLTATFTDPPSICNASTLELLLTNNQSDPLPAGILALSMSACSEYVPGTVTGMQEEDLSDLTNPVFTIPVLGVGESVEIELQQDFPCACLDSLDAGALFSNNYAFQWGATPLNISGAIFEVITPFLVITEVTNNIFYGSRGTVFVRTFTIRNTRFGALSSFVFEDQHEPSISVATNAGNPLPAPLNTLRVELEGTDFQFIGDGDALFEKDEEITIVEEVEILDCGLNSFSSLSTIRAYWGCDQGSCQMVDQTALVILEENELKPEIIHLPTARIPLCFCGPDPALQSIWLINEGTDIAYDLTVHLSHSESGVGIFPSSVWADSSGLLLNPTFEFLEPLDLLLQDCELPGEIYEAAILTFPYLSPGDSILLSWGDYFCRQACQAPSHGWDYRIDYQESCPPNNIVTLDSLRADAEVAPLNITLTPPPVLEDGQVHTYDYSLQFDSLLTFDGELQIEILFPCGLSWEGSPMVLGGISPDQLTVTQTDSNTYVLATYELPIPFTELGTSFDLSFACDSICFGNLLCQDSTITTCEEFNCEASPPTNLPVQVTTSFQVCAPFENDCAIQDCQFKGSPYFCELDSTCVDIIPAYFLYNTTVQRSNWGLPDLDNDRFPDASGMIDPELARLDRLIAGDTFEIHLGAKVIGALPDVALPGGLIGFSFQSFGIDVVNVEALLSTTGIVEVSNELQIFDASTGATYTCSDLPWVPGLGIGFSYDYFITVDSLLGLGCGVPADFLYADADSVSFTASYRVNYNLKKFLTSQPLPPIGTVNISPIAALYEGETPETRNDFFDCGCETNTLEISGFEHQLFPGIFAVEPCDTSSYIGATFFEFRLGLGNFFPFEFRNFLVLDSMIVELPPVIELVEAQINNLTPQFGNPVFSDIPIQGTASGDDWIFNFLPYQEPPMDEGFVLLLQYRFLSDCSFEGIDFLTVHSFLDWVPGLPATSTPAQVTETSNAVRAINPNLELENATLFTTSFDNQLEWIFALENSTITVSGQTSGPAENVWIQPISTSGLVENFELIDPVSGLPYPEVNGIFQVGGIDTNAIQSFQLTALNFSCEQELVELRFGWNCDPYLDSGLPACNSETVPLTGVSPDGTLELILEAPDSCAFLCDTVPFHTIELFNADLGAICGLELELELPDGFEVLPGSAEMSYPAGAPFTPIPDPDFVAGSTYVWDVIGLDMALTENCLKGVSTEPENRVIIRFLGMTDCNFVANSKLVAEIRGEQNCGTPTNTIRQQAEPICIQADIPPGQTIFNLGLEDPAVCNDVLTINVGLFREASTGISDSVKLQLLEGLVYVPGSVVSVFNGPSTDPVVVYIGNEQRLSWELPSALPPITPVAFQVDVSGASALDCGVFYAEVQATTQLNAFCAASADTCAIEAETGSELIPLEIERPILLINQFSINTASQNGAVDLVEYQITIANTGPYVNQPTIVGFYLDEDQNGMVSGSDILVEVDTFPPAGFPFPYSGYLEIPAGTACSLLAQILPGAHCACSTDTEPVEMEITYGAPITYEVCSGQSLDLDVCFGEGTYQWAPVTGLSCTDCCTPSFQFVNSNTVDQTLNYTVTVTNDLDCEVFYPVTIVVHADPQIVFSDPAVCVGEAALLYTTDGVTFEWEGPGLSGMEGQFVEVPIFETSQFTVTITDAQGCEGVDTALVEVLPTPLADAGGDQIFCTGDTPQVQAVDLPGNQYSWSPAENFATPTESMTLIIGNQAFEAILQVENAAGCIAFDTVFYDFGITPEVAVEGTEQICLGDLDTLFATGAVEYEWLTSIPFSCLDTDCSSIQIEPTESVEVVVVGINADGCADTTSLQIEVVDDQLFQEETVIACQGESVDVFGQMIDFEGIFCDTNLTVSGCLSVHCINLTFRDTFFQANAVQICEGEEYEFGSLILTVPGIYTQELVSSFGCDSTVQLELGLYDPVGASLELSSDTVLFGQSIFAEVIDAGAGAQFSWTPEEVVDCIDCPEVEVLTEESLQLAVTVTDSNGCQQLLEAELYVDRNCDAGRIELPNIFTPNGDGVNDQFGPLLPGGLEQVLRFEVWDRWGELVYQNEDGLLSWDGQRNGKEMPPDVYAYILEVACQEETTLFKGEITLVR